MSNNDTKCENHGIIFLLFTFFFGLMYIITFIHGQKCYQECLESKTLCTIEHFRGNETTNLPNGQNVITGYSDIFTIYVSGDLENSKTIIFKNEDNPKRYRYNGIQLIPSNGSYQTECYTYQNINSKYRTEGNPHNLCYIGCSF